MSPKSQSGQNLNVPNVLMNLPNVPNALLNVLNVLNIPILNLEYPQYKKTNILHVVIISVVQHCTEHSTGL